MTTWTKEKLFQPPCPHCGATWDSATEDGNCYECGSQPPPKPRQSKTRHRHNREFLCVLARSISGRQYLCERLNYDAREEVVEDIAQGQIYDPIAVFAFNPTEGWAKDISEEIARDVLHRYGITRASVDFLEDHLTIVKAGQTK